MFHYPYNKSFSLFLSYLKQNLVIYCKISVPYNQKLLKSLLAFLFSNCTGYDSIAQSCLSPCDPMDYTVHRILQARLPEWVAFPFSRESSQPRDQTQVSHIMADSLPAEPKGKPKNIGVGSRSLLQQISPTQESNLSLLHCRWILYQLSYQGSPYCAAVCT